MIRKRATGYLVQDIGLVLFLLCVGAMALAVGSAGEDKLVEFIVMFLLTFLAILLAGFKLNSLAVVAAGAAVLGYTAYKLYFSFAYSSEIDLICYVWIIFPILSVISMQLFIYGNRQTELENDVLKEQVEELVMVDPLTGLYNLKSLYNDLRKQIAYAERNKITTSLMIIQLRYEQELKKILSRSHFEALLQKLAELVTDTVRLEDRVYSLDEHGTIGIILSCNMAGSELAKKRIKSRIEEKDSFEDITDNTIQVEVRISYMEYEKDKYGNDLITFKQKVESELQYDV